MSEQVKQEGEFKLKAKRATPKKLVKDDQPVKVDLAAPKEMEAPIKVVIPKEQTDAIQEQSTTESVLRTEQPEVELQTVGQGNEGTVENVIEEINQQEVTEQAANLQQELEEQVQEQVNTGKKLP